MSVQSERIESKPPLPVFENTPTRHPTPMPTQTLKYWTPRAVFVSLPLEMIESLVQRRVLRRAPTLVTQDDE